MQFVDVKNDIAFRKIFGNENKKIILISFLNAVMKLEIIPDNVDDEGLKEAYHDANSALLYMLPKRCTGSCTPVRVNSYEDIIIYDFK